MISIFRVWRLTRVIIWLVYISPEQAHVPLVKDIAETKLAPNYFMAIHIKKHILVAFIS